MIEKPEKIEDFVVVIVAENEFEAELDSARKFVAVRVVAAAAVVVELPDFEFEVEAEIVLQGSCD